MAAEKAELTPGLKKSLACPHPGTDEAPPPDTLHMTDLAASTPDSRLDTLGGAMWRNSLARSLIRESDLSSFIHNGSDQTVRLWWGPHIFVKHGSCCVYFDGPFGRTLEWATPPPLS